MAFDLRSDHRQVERVERGQAGEVDSALGVADRDVLEAHGGQLRVIDGQLPTPVGRTAGEVLGGEARAAHIHAAGVRPA